jgi:hypothetical protein
MLEVICSFRARPWQRFVTSRPLALHRFAGEFPPLFGAAWPICTVKVHRSGLAGVRVLVARKVA